MQRSPERQLTLRVQLAVLTCVLLIIVASRVVRLNTLEMDADEVWSVWQTFGSPTQIIQWTPYDWPPLFYLTVGGWQTLTGIHPFTLRLFPLFVFLIALALLYRIARRVYGDTTALIAVTACAAMGYAINISLMLRGYILIFMLALLALWLALRYFNRPTLVRALWLAACLTVMFYVHITSLLAMALIGGYTLILFGRRIWRWWLPGVIFAALAIPELVTKVSVAGVYANEGTPIVQAWLASGGQVFFQVFGDLLHDFAGYSPELWVALIAIATALVLDKYRLQRRVLTLLLWMLVPMLLIFGGLFGAFTARHLAWVMPGFAVWLGWGFSRLPRAGIVGLLGVLIVMMFGPAPIAERYKKVDAPLVVTFSWLAQHMEADDVLVIDPNIKTVTAEEWNYFTSVYFPAGLQFVTDPAAYRRVWYIAIDGQQNARTYTAVQHDRAPTLTMGPPTFLVRLYEAAPDTTGIPFANGLRFHGAQRIADRRSSLQPGDTLHVRLWWSIDRAIDLDYSEGTYLVGSKGFLAQFDGPPQINDAPRETSRWITGRYYIEERELTLPNTLAPGDYPVDLAIYHYSDQKRIAAPGETPDGLLPLLTIRVSTP
ncbi:MAG: glycosyltransferase family 39 protein [Chloroflexota bacterium]